MRRIFDLLGENFSAVLYEESNLATRMEIGIILQNEKELVEQLQSFDDFKIIDRDSYAEWLLIDKIVSLHDLFLKINQYESSYTEEHGKAFARCRKLAESVLARLKKGDAIRFINTNYESVLVGAEQSVLYEMLDATINLCLESGRGVDDSVFFYYVDNFSYRIIDDFKLYKKQLCARPGLLDLFLKKGLEEVDRMPPRHKGMMEVVTGLKQDRSLTREQSSAVDEAFEKLVNDARPLGDVSEDVRAVMMRRIRLEDTFRLLEQIQDPRANEFRDLVIENKGEYDEFIKQNGHRFSYKVDLEPLIIFLRDNSYNDAEKMITLTRSANHGCVFPEGGKSGSLLDVFGSFGGKDSDFTKTYQREINCALSIGGTVVGVMLVEEDLSVLFFSWFKYCFEQIASNTKWSNKASKESFETLLIHMENVVNSRADDPKRSEVACEGALSFLYPLIERIVREVVKDAEYNSVYIGGKKATLGRLLQFESAKSILGENLCLAIEYIMLSRGYDLGQNRRNAQFHNDDLMKIRKDPSAVYEAGFLLLSLINSALYYYTIDKPNELDNNDFSPEV